MLNRKLMITNSNPRFCPNCGEILMFDSQAFEAGLTQTCPHCGFKMVRGNTREIYQAALDSGSDTQPLGYSYGG